MFCAPGVIFGGTEGVESRFLDLRSRTHFRRYRRRWVLFSCFALPDSVSAVPRASGSVFMFCAPGLIFGGTEGVESRFLVLRSPSHFFRYRRRRFPFSCFSLPDSVSAVPRASGSVFMFCAPGLIFGGTEGVESRFLVLRSRTHFLRYRRRRFPFSCFSLQDPFWAVPMASGPVFMFCAPRRIFGGTKGVGYRFPVLRSQTRFRRYRLCRVPFSCFALPDTFSLVPSASGPVFLFSAPGPVFGGTEGIGSHFNVFRSRNLFPRYRRRRVRFSCFVLQDSISAVPRVSAIPRASGLVFMFCAPGLGFGGTEGVWSRFHVLRSRTRFGRYRRRLVLFSFFALRNSFSAVPRASGPVFMFCAPRPIFVSTEGVWSRFHVLRSRTRFRRYQWVSGLVFLFCAPGPVLDCTEGVGSRFHVLRSKTRFRRYRGRRVPFSCFALPDSFSPIARASDPDFMFCAPGLIFGGTEGVESRFHVLRSRTHFLRYRRRRLSFSCFTLPDPFWAVPMASGPVFMFCAPTRIFRGTKGVGSRFHFLRCRNRFRRYRLCRFPFYYFALPNPFLTVPKALGPVFKFCAPRLDFGGTEGGGFRFHVLRSRTYFRR
jgi:hypothetical protein